MRRQALLILSFFFAVLVQAQVKISGVLKDNKGKPLPGATVSLKDTYDGGLVDSLGNFSFTTSEKGTFILVGSIVGYRTYEESITVGTGPITRTISLKEELSELKAVTVICCR